MAAVVLSCSKNALPRGEIGSVEIEGQTEPTRRFHNLRFSEHWRKPLEAGSHPPLSRRLALVVGGRFFKAHTGRTVLKRLAPVGLSGNHESLLQGGLRLPVHVPDQTKLEVHRRWPGMAIV